jgi:hypothetical protein
VKTVYSGFKRRTEVDEATNWRQFDEKTVGGVSSLLIDGVRVLVLVAQALSLVPFGPSFFIVLHIHIKTKSSNSILFLFAYIPMSADVYSHDACMYSNIGRVVRGWCCCADIMCTVFRITQHRAPLPHKTRSSLPCLLAPFFE